MPSTNSCFAKAGVSCFYESEVVNSSFVHVIKFSTKNTRLRKAAKRYKKTSVSLTEKVCGTYIDRREAAVETARAGKR